MTNNFLTAEAADVRREIDILKQDGGKQLEGI